MIHILFLRRLATELAVNIFIIYIRIRSFFDAVGNSKMVKAVCFLGPGGKPCSGEEPTTVCSGTVEFEQEIEEGPTKVGFEVSVSGL
jgi:hypothetical protein